MKATIEVDDREEAELIEAGLSDPTLRATVKVVGALLPFSQGMRAAILHLVKTKLEEENHDHATEAGQ